MYLFFYVSVFLLIIALHTEERHSHQSLLFFIIIFCVAILLFIRMGRKPRYAIRIVYGSEIFGA